VTGVQTCALQISPLQFLGLYLGKKWAFISYHTWDFKEGKIISGGDYFDAGGLMAFLQASAAVVEVSEE
jgi:hypothetical protein